MAAFRLGLIGDPVAHSRSPVFQNAALQHLGIDAVYELWHTTADVLPARIDSLRGADVLGANVTLPHKTAVLPLLDAVEPIAEQIGAVNTIYKRADGALVGTNTDAPGLLEDLRERGQFEPARRSVVLLGASGAARAAAYALVYAGVGSLVIANRTLERAEDLLSDVIEGLYSAEVDHPGRAEQLPEPQLIALTLDDPELAETVAACDLLINATAVGWRDDDTPLPRPPVTHDTLVYDMVYRSTRLLHDAAVQGARTVDGLGMLIAQGALAFERWTGQQAPRAVMWAAVTA